MKYAIPLLVLCFVLSCKNEQQKIEVKTLTADEIVGKSIAVSGGEAFDNAVIDFTFRDKTYTAKRQGGQFELSRFYINETSDSIHDMLSNAGFTRQVNAKKVALPDSLSSSYAASVNSVHYFSVLPYGLQNSSVNARLVGEETLKKKTYYKIEITFDEKGGGEDFEDVFMYWIDTNTFKVDYLAYSYNEESGIGMRFREVYNERYTKGLRFVDYNNYKPNNSPAKLERLGKLFEANQLKKVSVIALENIGVALIDNQ